MNRVRHDDEPIDAAIDRLLKQRRPDRLVMGGDDPDDPEAPTVDDDLFGRIASDLEAEVTTGELRRELLDSLNRRVRLREGTQMRSVNNLFRTYFRDGQWPLPGLGLHETPEWAHLPLGVISRHHEPGQPAKVVNEHVALRAVTAYDLRTFAVEERRRAARDFASREDACQGAERIASEMDDRGCVTMTDWASIDDDS